MMKKNDNGWSMQPNPTQPTGEDSLRRSNEAYGAWNTASLQRRANDLAQRRAHLAESWQDLADKQRNEEVLRLREQKAAQAQAQRRALIGENSGMFQNLMQDYAAAKDRQAQINRRGAVGLLSAYKIGASIDGGSVPPQFYTKIGEMLGFDNKSRAIGNIQVEQDGGLTIYPVAFDAKTGQGALQEPIRYSFEQVYGMGLENQGVLSRDEMEAMRRHGIATHNLTEELANERYPAIPEGYGDPNYVPVGGRYANGALNVGRAFSRGPRQKGGGGSFFSDGRGGWIRTRSDASTGFQTVEERGGTLADDYKGQWKVLRGGGGQTTYKNDKTGDVVTVRDGETPPWVANSGTSEKERIARMNNETRERVQQQRGAAQRDVAQVAADATKHKADASVEVAAQNGRAKTARGGGRSDGDSSASLRRILDKSSGATDEERRKTIAMLQAREERRDQELAMSDKDRALKRADDIIDLYGGDMSGFPIKDKEQIRKLVAGELYAGKEYDPDEWGSYFDNLRAQRAKNAQGAQKTGKAEVKTGDNGGGNERQGENDDGLPDNAQSRRYPGFKVATVKKALANGYVYDEKKGGFVKPKR